MVKSVRHLWMNWVVSRYGVLIGKYASRKKESRDLRVAMRRCMPCTRYVGPLGASLGPLGIGTLMDEACRLCLRQPATRTLRAPDRAKIDFKRTVTADMDLDIRLCIGTLIDEAPG